MSRSDCGTENSVIAYVQPFLRRNHTDTIEVELTAFDMVNPHHTSLCFDLCIQFMHALSYVVGPRKRALMEANFIFR